MKWSLVSDELRRRIEGESSKLKVKKERGNIERHEI